MRLIETLPARIATRIAFVGAGGKTTAMFKLARQFLNEGEQTVLISATTHLAEDQLEWADLYFSLKDEEDIQKLEKTILRGVVLLTGELGDDHRTKGLPLELMSAVHYFAQRVNAVLLIEADGSRRRPLKAPASHEPVIPPWVDLVVVVAGMSGLGHPLDDEFVHRPKIFGELSGLKAGETVSPEALSKLLLAKNGGLKGIPAGARRMVLLNQCNTDRLAGQAKQISQELLSGFGQVVVANLDATSNQEIIAVHRRIAGIVLAAGGSDRLGQPKQLLDWRGNPFVRAVAKISLEAGLRPVLVVTGAYRDQVESALNGMPVHVVHNPEWASGQASSVRTAIDALSVEPPEDIYGAMFFLVDQPQIPVSLARLLLEAYSETLSPIVAPLVDDRRGNPVLFDRVTFKAFENLKGDAGGRQVFSRFPVRYVPWLDSSAGWDVDTLDDYQRLIADI